MKYKEKKALKKNEMMTKLGKDKREQKLFW